MKASKKGGAAVRRYPKNWRWGLLFILPWLLGFLILQAYPLIMSLYYSFTDFSILSDGKWVGLENYMDLFQKDKYFVKSFFLTFKYALMSVPMKLIMALIVAMILNMKLKGINFFRTIYYLPSIMGGSVAISILWRFMFMKDGMINKLLGVLHIPAVNWLGDPDIALVTISLLVVWQFGSSMLIFLSALKQIPASLYEAADIDGAGKTDRFFRITLPLLTPNIFFKLVMPLINGFLAFSQCYIITQGKPMNSTLLYTVYMYQQSFEYYNTGYGAALAWVMLIIIGTMTAVLFATKKFWVYEGGF